MRRLVSIWKKFRKWGWIGVWNHFGGDKLRQRRFERFLLRNAQKYPLQPQRGITIIAPLTLGNSLNKVMRDLAFSLRDAGIPFNPLEREDPDISLSAQNRDIGGLGIFMVKKTMDDVTYMYENGHNVLTIRKNL